MASKQSSIRAFFQPRTNSTNPVHSSIPSQPPEPEEERERRPASEEQQEKETKTNTLQGAVISPVYENHISQLKRINALLLPINYPDNFYHKAISPDLFPSLSFVVLWNSPRPSSSKVYTIRKEQQVVGGIVCRIEQSSNTSSVYIQSLALLSPYRSQGLAAALLDRVIQSVVQSPASPNPTSLYAHVWTENTEGLSWYKARGFIADATPIQNYYSRLRPGTAYVLRRQIKPSDYLGHKCSNNSSTASKRSSDDWEMVESPNMLPKASSAAATIPFIAAPPPPPPLPTTSLTPKAQSNKKSTKAAQTYLNFPPAPPPTPSSTPNLPNPSNPPTSRPGIGSHTESFQNRAPESEWNDLPLDILGTPKTTNLSRTNSSLDTGGMGKESVTGSRSSSSSRVTGKKKRLYPAAAFGGAGSEPAI